MKILIADDDAVSRRSLESSLTKLGYDVVTAGDGMTACKILQSDDPPRLALLDWMMPEMDGVDVCRIIRATQSDTPPYIILLTGKTSKGSIVEGLESGADDYVTKPFDKAELSARLQVGCRILDLQSTLLERVRQLGQAHAELLQAEKLASVGQLAAGVAHELNTPMQFVGDNIRSCADMFENLKSVLDEYHGLGELLEQDERYRDNVASIRKTEVDVEIDFICGDAPIAFRQTLDGVERVQKIVQALKNYSQADNSGHKVEFDLNSSIDDTLTVASNQLEHIAQVITDFGDIPRIEGCKGELNQVFLNILVNAAHAIEDKEEHCFGTIRVQTRQSGNDIIISISDNGCGIPAAIRQKIYDPFFSTKEVGRGSGQGLTIARSIIMSHGGQIQFESAIGVGTTFRVRLPITQSHVQCETRSGSVYCL